MRKFTLLLLTLMLLSLLATGALAAQDGLTVSDAAAEAGQTVYITVSLDQSVTGDAMGIAFSYDEKALELVPGACQWKTAGVLQDFGSQGDSGVWAAETAQKLEGVVCILAFQVKENAKFSKTDVSCTLTVKRGTTLVGDFSADAAVIRDCTHSYSAWKTIGELGHSRTCSVCQGGQTRSHSWGQEVISEDPKNPGKYVSTATCADCGAEKVAEHSGTGATLPPEITGSGQSSVPTLPPAETWPIPSEDVPEDQIPGDNGSQSGDGQHDHTGSSQPYTDYNQGDGQNAGQDSHAGHDHGSTGSDGQGDAVQGIFGETPDNVIPDDGSAGNIDGNILEHTHDHNHSTGEASPVAVLIALAAVAALLIGGSLYFLKRKR